MTKQARPTVYFIGVTTARSSIVKIFPEWMRQLGRPETRLEGVDLGLPARPEQYRRAVRQVKEDERSIGAVVTAHKIHLLDAARDLFDYLDPYAERCCEVAAISKQAGRLEGRAIDPITSGLCLDSILAPSHFGRTGAQVLCLGAGGSATAIALHFIRQADADNRPGLVTVVDRSRESLLRLERMVRGQRTGIAFEYHCHADPERNDELMSALPPHSLVINATGMGKDLPGSPITHAGLFPERGIAWELNYRGEREFLRQALAQRQSRRLLVEDGWLYFLHGWTHALSHLLKLTITAPLFQRLSETAAALAQPALPRRPGAG